MKPGGPRPRLPWQVLLAEFAGTALLVGVGLSFVILNFGKGSPVVEMISPDGPRRLLTGFLFGTTGGLIALSPVGRESGAHINPAVTLGFFLMGKMRLVLAAGYVAAQLLGAVAGSLPLVLWGRMGRSVHLGATVPGPGYGVWAALAGEVASTFALVAGLFFFVRHRRIRAFTPLLFPFLYALMVFVEAPVSGTSTNPARTLGPAAVSGDWTGWWAYWLGPAVGAVLAVALHRLRWFRGLELEVAKLYHFEHDPRGVFKGQGSA
ncbi:MAG: aquaporin [Nitrospirota bacterium]|jgi:aquaporin Z